ncbi:type II toxin-antitoxin system VapC family toxin [Rhizobium tropici]|uniref:Ribonuclease VapC n=1 Tax=Rhizobium tropici TaxID=398 RepID=A0A329Y839_RHITR|nr:type II toxin-antitoxin system VapC family toxin [Rhizobium tropici]RAX39507.1 type II toxin-antitoxin system VapC family toxin [Rhizobium tropici]
MKYLLDSNAVIALMKGHPGFVNELRRHKPQDFAIPAIVVHELFYGAYKGQRVSDNLARVDALQFETLDFDKEDARAAGEIRAGLASLGTPIGAYDVLIAGQAVARDLILITHNVREFERVPKLRFEDWESSSSG